MTQDEHKPATEIKHFFWNAVGNASNTLTSLLFLMAVVRILGVNDGGVFSIAFTTSLILLTVGLYGIRNYQVTDTGNVFPAGVYVSVRLVTIMMMMIIGVGFCIINGYSIYKSAVVCLLVAYKATEAISDVFYGTLQKNRKLYIAGISMTIRALISIFSFVITMILSKSLLMSSLILLLSGFLPLLLVDLPFARKQESIAPVFSKGKIIKLFMACFPVFAVSFISLVVVNVPKYVIDSSLTEESQTIYNIIVMPGTSISLFSQIIIQSFLLHLAHFRDNSQMKRFFSVILKIILLIVLFTGLFTFVCYLWGDKLLFLLYGLELKEYIPLLLIVIVGAMFSSIAVVLSVALTTLRITRVQLYILLVDLIAALIISLLLIPQIGLFGAAMSYFIVMVIQFLLYAGIFIWTILTSRAEHERGDV